jgi:hypothetical protein
MIEGMGLKIIASRFPSIYLMKIYQAVQKLLVGYTQTDTKADRLMI